MAMSNLTGHAILNMNGFLSCLILFCIIGLRSVLLPLLRVDYRQSSFRSLSQGSPGMEKVNDWEGNFPALPQVTMYLLFPHSVAWSITYSLSCDNWLSVNTIHDNGKPSCGWNSCIHSTLLDNCQNLMKPSSLAVASTDPSGDKAPSVIC